MSSSRFILSGVPNRQPIDYCLEINPWTACPVVVVGVTPDSCARYPGARVDVWRCDEVGTYGDFPRRDLVDSWRMDESGVLVSGLSGLCLKVPQAPDGGETSSGAEVVQGECAPEDALVLDGESGRIQAASSPSLCLLPDLQNTDDAGYGTDGFGLTFGDCDSLAGGAKWRAEPNSVVVYPPPEESWEDAASEFYRTTASTSDGLRSFDSYMYQTQVIDYGDCNCDDDGDNCETCGYYNDWEGHSNSYTTFSYDNSDGSPITVTVEKLQGTYNDVVVRPLGSVSNIQRISDAAVSFELDASNAGPYLKLSVEFDADLTHACLLFADGMEDLQEGIPSMFDPTVSFYGIGYHRVNEQLTSGTEAYLAGGSFVVASDDATAAGSPIFSTPYDNAGQVKIRGRGIVSGKLSDRGACPVRLCGDGVVVSGITIVDAHQVSNLGVNEAWYCEGGWDPGIGGASIFNVKIMGWAWSDGINAGKGGHVSKSFVRVNDDGIKPFYTNSLFEDITIWQMKSGWAIMLAWLTEGVQSGVTVRNIVILHDDHAECDNFCDWPVAGCDENRPDGYGCLPSQATIGAVQGGSGTLSNVRLENIVVETEVWRPFFFGIQANFWGDTGSGRIEDVTLTNVSFRDGGREEDAARSIVLGGPDSPDQIQDISFVDLSFYDKPPETTLSDAGIDVLGETNGVYISASDESANTPTSASGESANTDVEDDAPTDDISTNSGSPTPTPTLADGPTEGPTQSDGSGTTSASAKETIAFGYWMMCAACTLAGLL